MNQAWQNFLLQQGAVIENGVVQHFGDMVAELKAAQGGTVLCDLSQFGVIRATGDDTQSFLQSMLSSDVNAVSTAQAQLSSLSTPKGRMLATFMIWQTGGDYFLQLSRPLCPTILKKLSMYVLRAKVKLLDASDEVVCLGLSGPEAAALVQQHFGVAPQEAWQAVQHETAAIIHCGGQRFQINTTPQHAPALWVNLGKMAHKAGSVCWDWLNIRAGVPVVTPDTREQFVPQMANFELIGGVSFKKGCYPGQEIVARMQYLGKSKRRMYLAHMEGEAAPQAGDELFSADMEDQASGMVVNATPAPGGGYDLLAVAHIASREGHTMHWKSRQGTMLQFLPLPYSVQ